MVSRPAGQNIFLCGGADNRIPGGCIVPRDGAVRRNRKDGYDDADLGTDATLLGRTVPGLVSCSPKGARPQPLRRTRLEPNRRTDAQASRRQVLVLVSAADRPNGFLLCRRRSLTLSSRWSLLVRGDCPLPGQSHLQYLGLWHKPSNVQIEKRGGQVSFSSSFRSQPGTTYSLLQRTPGQGEDAVFLSHGGELGRDLKPPPRTYLVTYGVGRYPTQPLEYIVPGSMGRAGVVQKDLHLSRSAFRGLPDPWPVVTYLFFLR